MIGGKASGHSVNWKLFSMKLKLFDDNIEIIIALMIVSLFPVEILGQFLISSRPLSCPTYQMPNSVQRDTMHSAGSR